MIRVWIRIRFSVWLSCGHAHVSVLYFLLSLYSTLRVVTISEAAGQDAEDAELMLGLPRLYIIIIAAVGIAGLAVVVLFTVIALVRITFGIRQCVRTQSSST